ncbi:cell division protein FtsB [Lactobacillus colini]|uniref:Cell division protein FtsB n=1 Tax=Lactobacillus colini TaxID=1819254 RepID=A0ABS4MB86_9LACO|nr:ATP-binding protein [Lactobacillus colini]MBP2056937.1 cell division protein FtsB [Lactobacillus colini]
MQQLLSLPNIPRSYTALAEILASTLAIVQIRRSKISWSTWLMLTGFGIGQFILQFLADKFYIQFWILGILINVFWMFLTIFSCSRRSITVLIYQTSKTFIIAEFLAASAWQIVCYLKFYAYQIWRPFFQAVLMFLIYSLIIWLLFLLQNNDRLRYANLNISKKSAWNSLVIAMMIFATSNLGFMFKQNSLLNNSSSIFMMRTMVDLCGLLLFYIQENQRYEHYLHNDLIQMNSMFQSQYEQYQAYRESSETVNRRFHDLKHQLDVIALEQNSKKRLSYINSLRDDIKQFKSDVKTGNPVVDVVLTRKNAYCIEHNIIFTCIANGKLLNKIDVMDLCSLLGNSLDNAIEAESKVTDPQKRLIDLRVTKKGNMVIYSLRNYTTQATKLGSNGLPTTTKKDHSQPHGYGLKSIRLIAKKYGGTLTITNKDNWFKLILLLPLS